MILTENLYQINMQETPAGLVPLARASVFSKTYKSVRKVLNAKICSICGDMTEVESLAGVIRGDEYDYKVRYVCKNCISQFLIRCDICETTKVASKEGIYRFQVTRLRNSNRIPENLYSSFANDEDIRYICPHCLINNFNIVFCEDCNAWHMPDMHIITRRHDGVLDSYNYKPAYTYRHYENGENKRSFSAENLIYFGLEIEAATDSRENVIKMREWVDTFYPTFLIMKHDGSITGGAETEFVTHPFTWEWYNMNHHEFIKICKKIKELRYNAFTNSSCGFHIHYTRSALSPQQTDRIHDIMYKSTNLFYNIVQRIPTSYCQIMPESKEEVKYALQNTGQTSNKYTAVHVTPQTIEFRSFASNIKPLSVFKNIEFIKCLSEFTKQSKTEKLEDVIRYAFENINSYPYLCLWMDTEFIIKKPAWVENYRNSLSEINTKYTQLMETVLCAS